MFRQYNTSSFHASVLCEFPDIKARFLWATDLTLLKIGRRVLAERAAVLTFSYDTIVESAIETEAGATEQAPPKDGRVPDKQLPYSDSKWNRALGYGVRFDEVYLQQTKAVLESVDRDRFYGHPDNALYPVPVLNLHGSLNWFVHTSRRSYPNPHGPAENPKEGQRRALQRLPAHPEWLRPSRGFSGGGYYGL